MGTAAMLVSGGLAVFCFLVWLLIRAERRGADLSAILDQIEAEDAAKDRAHAAQRQLDRDTAAREQLRDRFRR